MVLNSNLLGEVPEPVAEFSFIFVLLVPVGDVSKLVIPLKSLLAMLTNVVHSWSYNIVVFFLMLFVQRVGAKSHIYEMENLKFYFAFKFLHTLNQSAQQKSASININYHHVKE